MFYLYFNDFISTNKIKIQVRRHPNDKNFHTLRIVPPNDGVVLRRTVSVIIEEGLYSVKGRDRCSRSVWVHISNTYGRPNANYLLLGFSLDSYILYYYPNTVSILFQVGNVTPAAV